MLTTGFDRLPQTSKIAHAAALGLIAVNIVLVMMPAAVHRLSYGGEDSKEFLHRIGSRSRSAPVPCCRHRHGNLCRPADRKSGMERGRRMRNVFRFHAVLVRAPAYLEICCARWKNNHTCLVPLRPPGRSRSAKGIENTGAVISAGEVRPLTSPLPAPILEGQGGRNQNTGTSAAPCHRVAAPKS
jgi:hypothetical protein